MLEFFVLASEFWFLCNGLDLYYSITNPFFSYNKRYVHPSVSFVFVHLGSIRFVLFQ